jgi:hypothetical protein
MQVRADQIALAHIALVDQEHARDLQPRMYEDQELLRAAVMDEAWEPYLERLREQGRLPVDSLERFGDRRSAIG